MKYDLLIDITFFKNRGRPTKHLNLSALHRLLLICCFLRSFTDRPTDLPMASAKSGGVTQQSHTESEKQAEERFINESTNSSNLQCWHNLFYQKIKYVSEVKIMQGMASSAHHLDQWYCQV